MERKKAERERIKAAQEEKKRQQQGTAEADETSKPKIPEEEEDLVDALLKEIRQGITLRRRSMRFSGSRHRSTASRGFEIKQDDIARLQNLYQQATIEEGNGSEVNNGSLKAEQKEQTCKLSDSQMRCQSLLDNYKRQQLSVTTNGAVNDDNLEQHEQPPVHQKQRHSSAPSLPHYETTI